jgi:8-oxo-dGTP pyrophosphatase MutT (NUDIX family)
LRLESLIEMAQIGDEDSSAAAPAATVVVLRNTRSGLELLLVQRASELAFHGGAWVFPGGRVEAADRVSGDDLAHARRAAVRELAEETGLTLGAEALVPSAHWTTPKGRVRCFATWFFLAEFASGEVLVDGGEIQCHRWLAPAAALRMRAAGELVLPAPTFVTLSRLSAYPDSAAALDAVRGRAPEIFAPRPRSVAGGTCSLYTGDAAYAGGGLELPGPRHRLWMLERHWNYERTVA